MARWARMAWSALALLGACGSGLKALDMDGDGYTAEDGDCWDAGEGPAGSGLGGADIHPGAEEVWYDGVDQDCAGDDDYDRDGDGWVGAADETGEDCDDQDASVNPAQDEVWYDGVDQDCDDNDDDQDLDGYAGAADGSGEDCDDQDAAVNPGVEEVWYDGVDQDCDGWSDYDADQDGYDRDVDCDDTDPTYFPDELTEEIWYNGIDENCDGNDGDQDGDGYVTDEYAELYGWGSHPAHLGAGDCWDDDPETADIPEGYDPINGLPALGPAKVGPASEETWYDGVNQDCGEEQDFDQDGDGYNTAFYPNRDDAVGDDCVDGSALDAANPASLEPWDVNPGATESWYDGTDQDCAGDDDYDQDTDGYPIAGYGMGSDDDCDDAQPSVHPGAEEDCSTSADEDCDGDTNDEGAIGCTNWYKDGDGDGYGSETEGACICEATATYETADSTDCDDADADINLGAEEGIGDEVDQDCDGTEICNKDYDNDGYSLDGDTKSSIDEDCDDSREATAAEPGGDCDDEDATINPGEDEEAGDEIDQDCDGDELCYADADNDGYRTTSTVTSLDEDCDDSGEALASEGDGDCDDSSSGVSPGDTEITGDEIDQDCDGDEVCYQDNDNDGYRTTSTRNSSDEDCDDDKEASSSETSGDCDDSASTVHPGASEVTGDEIDQDCDGDEVCYVDADNDGYRTTSTVTSSDEDCDDSGEASSLDPDEDCDDSENNVYPGASEVCEDDVVNDCESDELAALEECGWDLSVTLSTSTVDVTRSGAAASDAAGTKVSFGGDIDGDGDDELLIAATGASSGAGRVYVVNGPPIYNLALSSSSAYARYYTGVAADDTLGTALAGGVDLDGDGYDDLALGAPGTTCGTAYVITGPALPASATLSTSAYDAALTGIDGGDEAGDALAGVQDQDGDGYPELLVGATRGSSVKYSSGDVYLVEAPLSTISLDDTSVDYTWGGSYSSERIGSAVASGDLDDDGTPDVLIGGYDAAVSSSSAKYGKVWLLFGDGLSAGVLNSTRDMELQGVSTSDDLGKAIAVADVDGDGADDFLAGAPGVSSGAGAAYLVLGGTSLPSGAITSASADATLTGAASSDGAGTSLAAADLTGDGAAEIILGAPGADGSGTDMGRVYIFFEPVSGSLSVSSADVIYTGTASSDAAGTSVAAGGDTDEDGYLDLLIGAPGYDPSGASGGGMIYYIPGTGY